MNLKYKEVLKLKGTWLYDEFTDAIGTKLCRVESATKNKVKLSNGSTILTSIFINKRQHDFRLATDEEVTELMEERYYEFLENNHGVLKAMAHSPKYKGWGGNAYNFAHDEVMKEYDRGNMLIDLDYVDTDSLREEFESND